MKFGFKVGEVAARCRQPGGNSTEDVETDETGRGLLTSFERPKKVARDFYCKKTTDDLGSTDSDDNKYENRMQTPKKIILFLGLVCAIAVCVLLYPDPGNSEELHHISFTASSRVLHSTTTGCRKTASLKNLELKYPRLANSVTNCDLPRGASLLGLLQMPVPVREGLKIGLVNIDEDEEQNWRQFTLGWADSRAFPFERVESKRLRWSDFYPEWIDEAAPARCPQLPMPVTRTGPDSAPVVLHAVVVELPCGKRDVGRLHVALAAAKVAADTGGRAETMVVLAVSKCRPPLTLFPCNDLLEHQDDLWLFQVDLRRLRERLAMPVGSCALSLYLDGHSEYKSLASDHESKPGQAGGQLEEPPLPRRRREAYATLLHTDSAYVCGAVVAGQSIRMAGSKRDLVALVDSSITAEQREGLELAGWILVDIERIRNPKSDPEKYNAWNYSKFRLWQLTQYDRVVYIDADLLVLQNLDFLFDQPEISATGNDKSLFNSGVMVIEPSNCTFDLLMDQIDEIVSYNGGDQGFLNEIFPWWHRIPRSLNFFKHFWTNGTAERDAKTALFRADRPGGPPSLHVIHYLGRKPWLCFRDYDCNWNQGEYRKYASDAAHARWWAVHDAMPARLQSACALRTLQKADIEFNRRRAEAAGFEDEHWKINITDPRLHTCIDDNCNWEAMLRHWGEPFSSRRRLLS